MSLGKGYKVGYRSASKSGGRKDIRSRRRRNFTRGENTARHMMFEHQDAQVERETQPSITILLRTKETDKFTTSQELEETKNHHRNIITAFKDLEYYLNENLIKDDDRMSWNEEETEEWESMDEEELMKKYYPEEYQKMLDDESDEFDEIDAKQQNMD